MGKKARYGRERAALRGRIGDLKLSGLLQSAPMDLYDSKSGERLPDDMTIDLAARSQGGETPSFEVKPALGNIDPMKAFTKDELKSMTQAAKTEGYNSGMSAAWTERQPPGALDAKPITHAEKLRTAADGIEQAILQVAPENRQHAIFSAVGPRPLTKMAGIQNELDKLNPLRRFMAKGALGLNDPASELRLEEIPDVRRLREGELGMDLERVKAMREEILSLGKDPKLGRVSESVFHKVVEAWQSRSILIPANNDGTPIVDQGTVAALADVLSEADPGIFLLQHDWAGAFSGATDYAGGEIKMPYQLMVVECLINDRRICLMLAEDGNTDEAPNASLFVKTSLGWSWCGSCEYDRNTFKGFFKTCSLFDQTEALVEKLLGQVRAICIALEAEVAESDIVRAPHKLNQKRERSGKLPLFDYHVVSLAGRRRYAPRQLEPGEIEAERRHKRLHFVRGHFRHYENHKTWVKWHLRGDPDLGFVDKEYRL